MRESTIVINAGNVQYSLEESAVTIDDMIEMLEMAKEEGATHVVGASGNYRGPQWVRLGRSYDWANDE
jgi:hypothetical protein